MPSELKHWDECLCDAKRFYQEKIKAYQNAPDSDKPELEKEMNFAKYMYQGINDTFGDFLTKRTGEIGAVFDAGLKSMREQGIRKYPRWIAFGEVGDETAIKYGVLGKGDIIETGLEMTWMIVKQGQENDPVDTGVYDIDIGRQE